MAERIEKKEFVRRLAERMQTDEETAAQWLDGVLEEIYQTFAPASGSRCPALEASTWIEDERAGPSSSTPVRSCAPSSAGPPLIAAHYSTDPRPTCTLKSARTRRFSRSRDEQDRCRRS